MFKVIVAGSRDYSNYPELSHTLDKLLTNRHPDIEIISGTARGADSLGERYAEERGYPIAKFPADWEQYGKRAGYIRNEQMADYADALVAFWDGISSGTNHMIDIARAKGLMVRVKYFHQ